MVAHVGVTIPNHVYMLHKAVGDQSTSPGMELRRIPSPSHPPDLMALIRQ